MAERVQFRPVRRVRAEFGVSLGVKNAVNQFLESPVDTVYFHTTTERIVERDPLLEQHYKDARDRAKMRLQSPLAQRALILLKPEIEMSEQKMKLVFSVADPTPLELINSVLSDFPDVKAAPLYPTVAIELARVGLRSDRAKLEWARRSLSATFDDPATARNMQVGRVHLDETPIEHYPIKPGLHSPHYYE